MGQLSIYVNLRFGAVLRQNPLAELKNLRRIGSVDEYQRQFQFLLLVCRCDDLTPKMQMNFFTAGLGDPLMTDVELQKPTYLQHTMSMARTYEAAAEAIKGPLTRSVPSAVRGRRSGTFCRRLGGPCGPYPILSGL